MTREEAANWLINIMADIGYEQALSEIRELLEAQPEVIACGSGELIVDATGDLVSRAAAIDDVCKMMYECFGADDEELDAIEVTLRELPAVQPATNCSEIPNGSDDTISRQAAIDALDIAIERYDEIAEKYRKKADIERNDYMDMRDNAYEAQQLAQWLNELKYLREKIEQITIKTEPKWIPISKETNPTKSGWYLVTVHEDATDATNDNERFTGMAEFNAINGMWYDIDEPTDMYLRWMPLPAPYRGGEMT